MKVFTKDSAIPLAVETGLSVHAVAAALGHESETTTLQSYAKAEAGDAARQQRVLTVLDGGEKGASRMQNVCSRIASQTLCSENILSKTWS